jgi:hypothetical protein
MEQLNCQKILIQNGTHLPTIRTHGCVAFGCQKAKFGLAQHALGDSIAGGPGFQPFQSFHHFAEK